MKSKLKPLIQGSAEYTEFINRARDMKQVQKNDFLSLIKNKGYTSFEAFHMLEVALGFEFVAYTPEDGYQQTILDFWDDDFLNQLRDVATARTREELEAIKNRNNGVYFILKNWIPTFKKREEVTA